MILQFDGTLPGFLTAVFEGYPFRKNLRVEWGQTPSFLPDTKKVITQEDKAKRVLEYLKAQWAPFVYREFKWGVLTDDLSLYNDLAHTIYLMIDQGKTVLYSDKKSPRAVMKNAKRLSSECHSYKGLTRFKELDGGVLYGPIRPKGNIIYPLAGHFKARLPKEVFLIHDVGRNSGILYEGRLLEPVDVDSIEGTLSKEEEDLQALWRTFTKAVSIGPRRNLRLQKSNMPKRYWEFLTEMQGEQQ